MLLNWKKNSFSWRFQYKIEVHNLFELYLFADLMQDRLYLCAWTHQQIVDWLFKWLILKDKYFASFALDYLAYDLYSLGWKVQISNWKAKFHAFEEICATSRYWGRLRLWALSRNRWFLWDCIVFRVRSLLLRLLALLPFEHLDFLQNQIFHITKIITASNNYK